MGLQLLFQLLRHRRAIPGFVEGGGVVALKAQAPGNSEVPGGLLKSKLGLEGANLLGNCRLAVCSVVLMQNTLAYSLVELLASQAQCLGCLILVTCGYCLVDVADYGLNLGTDSYVTQTCLFVGQDTLLLGLDVSHFNKLSRLSFYTVGRGFILQAID